MGVLVLPVACRALLASCGRLGLDPDALLRSAGLSPEELNDPDARVSSDVTDAVWREAYAAGADPFLALHAAEGTPFGAFRVLDYLAASSATIGDGLRRVADYFPLVDPRGVLAVEESAQGAAMTFDGAGGSPLPPPAQEYTLAILASRIRHVASEPGLAMEARFAFARPADPGELARFFGAEPRFGAPRAALALPRSTWERRTPSADPGLFAALDDHARRMVERLPGSAGTVARVRSAVAAELAGREPALAAIARRLGTSRRSLQRRLGEEGTSFQEVLDAVRRERAEVFLRAPDVSVAEVSWLLGFAEQSAFTRAFRRWTKESPSRWRRALRP